MNLRRTVKIKIENIDIQETLDQYFAAYQYCLDKGFAVGSYSKKKLHDATYINLREMYPRLTSNLVQTARDVACENLKSIKLKTKPKAKSKFIRYDRRNFSFKNGLVSISTTKGRLKFVVNLPEYAKKYLTWNCKAAILFQKKNKLYLSLIFETVVIPTIKPNKVLGIDRGINNIVVTSNNQFYNSKHLKKVKGKYQYLRAQLQSKGTPSAKRKLRKISGKEKRFTMDVNHCLSKQLAAQDFNCYVLEDLTKIRKRNNGRKFNRKLGNWSFYQLEQFLWYKLEEQGKTLVKVKPEYTSQRCSKCGHVEKSNRNKNQFRCKSCGFELHADLNVARNIAYLGISEISRLSINRPNVMTIC